MQITQTNRKGCEKSSKSEDFTQLVFAESARNAHLMMTTAVAKQYSHDSLTSWLKNLLYKRLLKLLAISVFSCPNSTVNSILLSSSGVQSRNIFRIIVTIPS